MKYLCVPAILCALTAAPLHAQSQGDWTLGLGVGWVGPKSDNGTLTVGTSAFDVDVNTSVRPTITAEYFIRDNLGVEILAAWPFEHDIDLVGLGRAGTTKHLPPTISLNYHFPTQSAWKPYVGIGVNYTYFFDEESALGDLDLDGSWGVAVQAGIDYSISQTAALRANVRWIDIDTDVTLDGTPLGEAEIDPIIVQFAYVFKF